VAVAVARRSPSAAVTMVIIGSNRLVAIARRMEPVRVATAAAIDQTAHVLVKSSTAAAAGQRPHPGNSSAIAASGLFDLVCAVAAAVAAVVGVVLAKLLVTAVHGRSVADFIRHTAAAAVARSRAVFILTSVRHRVLRNAGRARTDTHCRRVWA